jgi:hypothetical protein
VGASFFYAAWAWGFLQWPDGATGDAWMPGCQHFPGLKIGKIYLYVLPCCLFGSVDYKSFLSYASNWNYFLLPFFGFSQSGFIKNDTVNEPTI